MDKKLARDILSLDDRIDNLRYYLRYARSLPYDVEEILKKELNQLIDEKLSLYEFSTARQSYAVTTKNNRYISYISTIF